MPTSKSLIPVERIEKSILFIRGQRVMLDADLAELYGVTTKRLNEQVKRNINRFPKEFMFQLTKEELENWRSQFATSNPAVKMGLRRRPYAFTEYGAVMLQTRIAKMEINQLIETQKGRILNLKADEAHDDNFVRDHLERAFRMITLVANKMSLPDKVTSYVRYAGLLHDFGGLFIIPEAKELYKHLEKEIWVKDIKHRWKIGKAHSQEAYHLFKDRLAKENYSSEGQQMFLDLFFQVEHSIDEIERRRIDVPDEVKDLIRYSARNMYDRIDNEINFGDYPTISKEEFKLLVAIIVSVDVFDNGNSIIKQRMRGRSRPRSFDKSIKFLTDSSYKERGVPNDIEVKVLKA